MFLKVMHDGADEFLATADSDATYSIYADVVDCHFKRHPDDPVHGARRSAEAQITYRSPGTSISNLSTVSVILTGDAFLMNEQGRTISKFKLRGYRAGDAGPCVNTPEGQALLDEQEALRLLKAMPYAAAAAIRTSAKQAGSVSAAYLIGLLDKAKVAMDA